MTGLELDWYFEDVTGDKVEFEPEEKYVTDQRYVQFIRLVNTLYSGVFVHNVTEEDMLENIKNYRKMWISIDRTEAPQRCFWDYMIENDIVETHLKDQENKFNIKSQINSQPIYRYKISDSFLKTAEEMFILLAKCPDKKWNAWKLFYSNLFQNFPVRTILQNLVNINKVTAHRHTGEYRVSESLIEVLNSYMKLDNRFISVASSTHSELLGSHQMQTFYKKVETCFNYTSNTNIKKDKIDLKCQNIMEGLTKLGNFELAVIICIWLERYRIHEEG